MLMLTRSIEAFSRLWYPTSIVLILDPSTSIMAEPAYRFFEVSVILWLALLSGHCTDATTSERGIVPCGIASDCISPPHRTRFWLVQLQQDILCRLTYLPLTCPPLFEVFFSELRPFSKSICRSFLY